MPAEPFHDFPLSDNWEWDADESERGLRQWASSDGSGDKEKIDWNKLRKCYFWHEAGELKNFNQLKFPYCRIENDEPHVVHNAVQNALARIDGSNIPEEDKPEVRRVAERQMARFQEKENQSREGIAFVKQFGQPTPSQLEKINALAKRPLSAEEVFVFSAKLVGDMIIPNRYIKIDKSLLEVFKQDAQRGIAFMLDHPWAGFGRPKPALAYGRTFDAVLKPSKDVEGETWALYADHYIVRGKEKDGISTDAIIADIEDGTLFDTSIGWGADTYECSVCGNDIRDFSKCEHWPGQEYDGKLCYVIAKPPGFLMENSGVFDGAYPTAGILSKFDSIDDQSNGFVEVENIKNAPVGVQLYHIYSANRGQLITFAKRDSLEKKLSITIPEVKHSSSKKEEGVNLEEIEIKLAKETVENLFGGVPENLESKLIALAKDGQRYREELINETLDWGVRAFGNDFDIEGTKKILSESTRTLDDIKSYLELYKKAAKEILKPGRVTQPTVSTEERYLPDEAFKVK